jgi:hypothetical protein
MRSKINTALIASLGVIALSLVTSEASAASSGSRGGFTSTSQRLSGHVFRHHRRLQAEVVWPGDDGVYGPNGEATPDGVPPAPGDLRYSNTNDIPWDWAHRHAPTERPYVPSCPAETVTVPDGHGGRGQVNIVRCY